MADFASLVITPVVESLLVPVRKHLGFYVSSTKHVTDMKAKLNWLNSVVPDIRREYEDAVQRNHEVSNLVTIWLDEVEKVNKEEQSIPASGTGCFNIVKRYKAGRKSYKILEEIQDLKKRKLEIKFTHAQKPLAEVVSTSTWPSTSTNDVTQKKFKSRDVIYKAVLESLQPHKDSEKMIALCGMGGVGKTTMMEQVVDDVRDSKMFNRIVKVVLGEKTDPFALQSAIAEYIGEELKEKTTCARADRLRNVFQGMAQKGQNKILVIMDDLWNEIDLKDVGLSPLPDGFKLLFTSRFERVCNQMGVETCSVFNVPFLDDVEAQTLFFENVKLSDGDDPGFRKIGEDIVNKCGGLPIAIVTIAKCLSGKIKKAWEKALKSLQKGDLKDLETITCRIFEISYKNIKEDIEKAIFLLSGLFPDDFNIRTEDLLRFGWGLGFFKDASTLTTARDDVEICVSNLISSNLLTKSDLMGCVKMHDLVRAFVLDKIPKVKQVSLVNLDGKSKELLTRDAKESYHRTGLTEFLANFNYPNLSMLMLMNNDEPLKFPEDIYGRMEKLQVVSYEDMYIPSLLLTFKHSTTLQTLSIRSCIFINDDISLLGSLSNLETLSIVDCGISRLPLTIGKLKKLKLLDLTGCLHLRIDDGVFQNLDKLEELYMRAGNGFLVHFTDTNCNELEKLSRRLLALEMEFFETNVQPKYLSFKNLERFRISIGCKLEELIDDEKNLFKNTIQFVGDCNELLECKISELFNKTGELHLQVSEMHHLEDILLCHSFSDLTILHISKCRELACLFTVDVACRLKKLKRLTISECPIMRTLIVENSREDVIIFPKLSFMSLTNLPHMVSLWDNKIEFPEMEELILDGLPNFISIYPDNHNSSEKEALLNEKVVISKLEKLDISNMENLKHIWSCDTTNENNVSMLRKIIVKKCDSLNNLFPSNPFPTLDYLEELEVEKCGSIEVLFNMELESVCETRELNCSKLRSICVEELGKLKELWRMKGVNKCDIHVKCFKGVERIKIKSCPIFKYIFTPTTINFDLGGLTDYVTKNIGEEINEISELDESTSNVTYPSHLLQICHQLQRLKLKNDKRVEEMVFEMDSPSSKQLQTIQDGQPPPLLLPYLEDLDLRGLKKMSHVWKCNWNKFSILHHPPFPQLPFQNLTSIFLENCPKLKYLFSPLMAKYLSNLKEVRIFWCDGIEEVISSRDDEDKENTLSHQNMIALFPKLDGLCLSGLSCLKSTDGHFQSGQASVACWSLCQYPTDIFISKCDGLSSLVPWYSVGQMKRLQKLIIFSCKMMKEVFESESNTCWSNNINVDQGSPPTLLVPQLTNLKSVLIYECDLLSHVFTFSTLETLKQLEELHVESCKSLQVIVKEENIITSSSSKDVQVFLPRLKMLFLNDLPNLKGFFLGKNEFRFPLLDDVVIRNCPQLMMFTSGHSETPKLKYICTSFQKFNVEHCGLYFHGTIDVHQNLIEIKGRITGRNNIIPSNVLLQLEKLEKIKLYNCDGVEEVFESLEEGNGFNESQHTTHVVKIPNLTKVTLRKMSDLKYLWKNNRSMVLEFPNLTKVYIDKCNKLEYVFTCSMVGSLVQLQNLQIYDCKNIEVVVKEEEEEECDIAKVNLPRLKSLTLDKLPKLKGFCLGKEDSSLPLLDTLEINECPEFKGFTQGYLSTPELKVIETTFGNWYVKPDLNSFIKTKQREGYEF